MELKKGKLTVTAGFALTAAAVLVVFGREMTLWLFLASAVHETGHILAIILMKGSIRDVTASAGGLRIGYGGELTCLRGAVIALAGPAAGALFSLAAAKTASVTGCGTLYRAAGVSMALSAVNMLPVSVLDGGAVLEQLAALLPGDTAAERLSFYADTAVCGSLFAAGIAMMFTNKRNISLVICAIAAWRACCKKREHGVIFL